jgi:tight adherence protein B
VEKVLIVRLLLLGSLFLLFYCLAVREFPEPEQIRAWLAEKGAGLGSAALFFALASLLWGPLAGIPWAFLGLKVPGWLKEWAAAKRKEKLSAAARDLVQAAAALYGAGMTTPYVMEELADRLPEPLAGWLKGVLADRDLADGTVASVPQRFQELAKDWDLPELSAVADIIEISTWAGGPQAAARGLKRLSLALRQRERLLAERVKANMEAKIAALVTLVIIAAGLVLDGTFLRPYFAGPGRLVLAAASALTVGMIFLFRSIGRSEDLEAFSRRTAGSPVRKSGLRALPRAGKGAETEPVGKGVA